MCFPEQSSADRCVFSNHKPLVTCRKLILLLDSVFCLETSPARGDADSEACSWAPSSPYHSFVMGIRSLSEMDIKLHELSIKGRQNGISNAIFSRASPKDYNHLLNVFANLRKISLHINTHGDTHPLLFAGLGRLLIHATLLQSLDLSCLGGQRQARLILSRVFQNATWPHLKHFGLHGFVVHSDAELIAFFDRHRATIDSVALKSMFLHDKDINSPDPSFCQAWKHFFGELRKRAIEFQKLDLYRIQDCYNSAAGLPDLAAREKKVLQYLRHGGPNPFASDVIS